MNNFFYEGEFYHELCDLLEALDIEEGKENELPDDWCVVCFESDLEPVIFLSTEWIMERINEERFSEEADELSKVQKILDENIPFDKINSLLPKLYYESRRELRITKEDVLEYIK